MVAAGVTTLLVVPVTSPTPPLMEMDVAPDTLQEREDVPPGRMVPGAAVNARTIGRTGVPSCSAPVKHPAPPSASARAATRPAGR